MESAKTKPPVPGSSKSGGHIEDIGIDFLQPQEYYWDAVKSRVRSQGDLKAIMLGKRKLPMLKVAKASKTETIASIGNHSDECNALTEKNEPLKLPIKAKQHRKEADKDASEPLSKEILKKTEKILKGHPDAPRVREKTDDFIADSKARRDECHEDSPPESSILGQLSKCDSGLAIKKKIRSRRYSCSSESVGSDSSNFENNLSSAAAVNPLKKKLTRRRERFKRCKNSKQQDSKETRHNSTHNLMLKKMKIVKDSHHKVSGFDPEAFFKKYWICAAAVNDPKLRMLAVVRLIRMTSAFIESWCKPKHPEQRLTGESTHLPEKKRRISSSSGDSRIVSAEVPAAVTEANKFLQSNNLNQSNITRENALPSHTTSDKAVLLDPVIVVQLSTSNSDSAASDRDFTRGPHSTITPKQSKSSQRQKMPIMLTSSGAIDEIIASVSRQSQLELDYNLEDLDSGEQPLHSTKKVQGVASTSQVIPSSPPSSENSRPILTPVQISNTVNINAISSHSGNSPVKKFQPCVKSRFLNQKGKSNVKMALQECKFSLASGSVNRVYPNVIRLPCTEEELRCVGIDTRVYVLLERIVLPFLGSTLYPNVVCYDLAAYSSKKSVLLKKQRKQWMTDSSEESEDGFADTNSNRPPKHVISRRTKERFPVKECDGQMPSQDVTSRTPERSRFPRIKLKERSGDSGFKHQRLKKSRLLVPTSSEDSDSGSTPRLSKCKVSKPKTLDVDQIGVALDKVPERIERRPMDVLCTVADEDDKSTDSEIGSLWLKAASYEKSKRKNRSNKSELSKTKASPRDSSRKQRETLKRGSGYLEREHSAEQNSKRKSNSKEICIKELDSKKRTSKEHSSRVEDKRCDRRSRLSSALPDVLYPRSEARSKRESKSKKHNHHRKRADDSSKLDISHGQQLKRKEKHSHAKVSSDQCRIDSSTDGLKLSLCGNLGHGQDNFSLHETDGSSKDKCSEEIIADSAHKDCSESSSWDLERAYDSLCNIPTELVESPDDAEVETLEEDICEDFFLLNNSCSGLGSEHEKNREMDTVEQNTTEKQIGEETMENNNRSEANLKQETLEANLQRNILREEHKEKTFGNEVCIPGQQDIQQYSTLSDSNSDVYDPLDDFEPNYKIDFYDGLTGENSTDNSFLSSTYTAPSPTSTAPSPAPNAPGPTPTAPSPTSTAPSPTSTAASPTSTAPSPTSTAPSPISTAPSPTSTAPIPDDIAHSSAPASLNQVLPTPAFNCESALSIILSDDGQKSLTGNMLALDEALFHLTELTSLQRSPPEVVMDTDSKNACLPTKVTFELPNFADQQQSKNAWNMDKMSIVANKSQQGEEDESGMEVDALSLLAPSLAWDSIFGGEEFEENVPSKDPTSVAAVHSSDNCNQNRNDPVQSSRQQLTAIVRPMTFLQSSMDQDSDQGSEKEKVFMLEFVGKSISELLEQLNAEIEKRSIKKAVSLFNFLETKMVGSLKYNMLDSLLIKTASGGILSPQQLHEVVKIVNKVVPSFCDNLKNQVQIFRKCLKTILACRRTTSLKLLSLRLTENSSYLGLTKLYNDILLAAVNADASEVLHLYKEGQNIGIRLDFVVVRALLVMFQTSNLHFLARDVYELGCFIGGYPNIMINEWPVCLKLRSYYTEHEIDTIFKDFISKVAVHFKGDFFTSRPDLTEKEKYTIFISIEDLHESEGRNVRYLRDAEPSLEAVHKRICNVLHMNNITQYSTTKDGRIMEMESGSVYHLLTGPKLKNFRLHPTLRRPHWVPSVFNQIFASVCENNPF